MKSKCLTLLLLQSINLPAGKTLGGTSVLNMMINTPGPDTDYTAWQTMGAAG